MPTNYDRILTSFFKCPPSVRLLINRQCAKIHEPNPEDEGLDVNELFKAAFNLLHQKTPKQHLHLMSWHHVEDVAATLKNETLPDDVSVQHKPAVHADLDHPDWMDWRQHSEPERIEVTIQRGNLKHAVGPGGDTERKTCF